MFVLPGSGSNLYVVWPKINKVFWKKKSLKETKKENWVSETMLTCFKHTSGAVPFFHSASTSLFGLLLWVWITSSSGCPPNFLFCVLKTASYSPQVRSQKHFLESVIFKFTSLTILVSPFLCVYFIIIMMEGGEAILKRNKNKAHTKKLQKSFKFGG